MMRRAARAPASGICAGILGAALLVTMSVGAVGCSEAPVEPVSDAAADTVCQPDCAARECGSDGCGGWCGDCPEGAACDAGHCAEPACVPACSLAQCGADDGCGATCTACPNDVSCADCALQLSVGATEVVDGLIHKVTLIVDFGAPDGAVLPELADVRLKVEGPAMLTSLSIGPPLMETNKALFADPDTGLPYRLLGDDTYQVLVHAGTAGQPIHAGRWLFFEFALGDEFEPPTGPVVFQLVEREATFAPDGADALVVETGFGEPVVVWPGQLKEDAVEPAAAPEEAAPSQPEEGSDAP